MNGSQVLLVELMIIGHGGIGSVSNDEAFMTVGKAGIQAKPLHII